MARKLSPDGRRIRTIIITAPFLVASSILLYKRLVLGEEQRHLPRPPLGRAQQAERERLQQKDGLEGVPSEVMAKIREAEEQSRR
ncbi:hypothetical protein JCM10213_008221 [Rhodosporidiobolus nylandii]